MILESKTPIKVHSTGMNIALLVQPGASQNGFMGLHGNRLKLRVTAKATDGAANGATMKFMAKYFGVPKSAVRIIRGLTAREKTIEITGNPVVLTTAAEKLLRL